jgi:hypothetical protein
MGTFGLPLNGSSLTTEPVSGGDNSLSQYLRSLTNFGGTSGTAAFGTGQQLIQPAADYWSAILSGNPQALTAATAPTASMLSTLYSGATNNASTGLPQGGYRSTQIAQLPFSQAQQVGNYLLGLQPQAASQLGQLGTTESGLGSNMLAQTLQALMQRRGQNMTQDTANLGMLTSGLSSLLGSASGAYGANQMAGAYSDERLKEGIVPLGMVEGIPVYAFRYKGDEEVRLGVMAQEVRDVRPDAVFEGPDGYLMVRYDKLFNGVN